MTKLLKFLSGKKTIIQTIVVAIVGYAAVKGWIGEAELALISAINFAIFGGVSIATTAMYKKEEALSSSQQ